MKRFILTIMCVSVFFIGIGSIIEKTSAKFTSDAKALEIINKARIAIGGDANIKNVESISIVGTSTNFFEKEGIQNIKQGSLEINMQLPGQFNKIVRIGDAENNAGEIEIIKETDVVVLKEDGVNAEFKNEDGKVIITKEDGTTEEVNIDGKSVIRIKKDANGNITTEDMESVDGENTFVFKGQDGNISTEDIKNIDGKKVIIVKGSDGKVLTENIVGADKMKFVNGGGMRGNEMLRTTIALLMTAPQGSNVSYEFVGTGNVDGNPSNIIHVISNDSSFKLYVDAATNLPQMISFYENERNPKVFNSGIDSMKNLNKEQVKELVENMKKQPVHNLKFSDFRSVGNLLLPHRWTETSNSKQVQNVDITSYEINPANIADKFSNQKVFVRKMKSKN